jgi:polygalacturonase
MLSGHGGVVIGSEMSGDVRKITISNCVFDGTDRGIRIKTARGRGGVVEEIRVDNIIMKNIKEQAIVLDMQYAKTEPAPVSERTPQFRNIHFSNITAQTNQSIFINGLAEMPVDDITFNDIQFEAKTGATIKEAKNIEFHNVRITTEGGSSLIAENVSNLTVNNLKTLKPVSGKSVIDLNNVQQVFLYNCNLQNQTEVFLTVKGDKTRGVIMKNNNLSNALKALVKGDEVAEKIIVE